MTNPIFRQYVSPNCTLKLQGFSDETSNDALPVMNFVTLVQCEILNQPEVLQGGLTFLDNLTKATSSYTQGLLSGLHHQDSSVGKEDYVNWRFIPERNRHLLLWQENQDTEANKKEIEFTTIQLFDLLDTLDQLSQDNTTLPQLQNPLQPLSRRYRQSEISLIEQSTPATLGLITFTLAAIALFVIPNPTQIKDPNQAIPETPVNNTEDVIPSNPSENNE